MLREVFIIIVFEVFLILSFFSIYKWLMPFWGNSYKYILLILFLISQLVLFSYWWQSRSVEINFNFIIVMGFAILFTFFLSLVFLLGLAIRGIITYILPSSFSKVIQLIFAFLLPLGLAFLIGKGIYNNYQQTVVQYQLEIDKQIDKPIKLLLLADQHIGQWFGPKSLKDTLKIVDKINPDAILIAGDIIDHDFADYTKQNMGQYFKQLKAKYGVYAVLGNHDTYAHQQPQIIADLESNGITVLRDQALNVNDIFWVVGRKDLAEGYDRIAYQEIVANNPELQTTNLPIIVIDHQPSMFDELNGLPADLQVSGHTHAGQTFPINLIVKYFNKYFYGLYTATNLKQHIIVTGGVGLWGIPFRIGTRAEVVEIIISAKK